MPKSRLSAVLSLLLVFVSGGILGVFSCRLYSKSPKRMSPEEFRNKYVSELTTAAKLEASQVAALNQILDQTRDEAFKINDKARVDYDAVNEKYRPDREALHNRQVERIKALLHPNQVPLYDAFRVERERQRKLHAGEHKKQ
jgi:hypothetical protein